MGASASLQRDAMLLAAEGCAPAELVASLRAAGGHSDAALAELAAHLAGGRARASAAAAGAPPPPRRAAARREPQRAPPPPRRVDREPQRPAPAPGRNDAWRPVDITKDDWVVYLRAQKTGSQTLWTTLLDVFDGGAWGPRRCVRGPFCGHRCENVLRDAFIKASKERKCHLFVRAHANLYDYQRAFESVSKNGRVHYLAFLRDPVKRALSEHDHITNGLVAQFGPHVFGKAWDYDFATGCDCCAPLAAVLRRWRQPLCPQRT